MHVYWKKILRRSKLSSAEEGVRRELIVVRAATTQSTCDRWRFRERQATAATVIVLLTVFIY